MKKFFKTIKLLNNAEDHVFIFVKNHSSINKLILFLDYIFSVVKYAEIWINPWIRIENFPDNIPIDETIILTNLKFSNYNGNTSEKFN